MVQLKQNTDFSLCICHIFIFQRLDGRTYNESRKLNIAFGSEYGSCVVSLGETKLVTKLII